MSEHTATPIRVECWTWDSILPGSGESVTVYPRPWRDEPLRGSGAEAVMVIDRASFDAMREALELIAAQDHFTGANIDCVGRPKENSTATDYEKLMERFINEWIDSARAALALAGGAK